MPRSKEEIRNDIIYRISGDTRVSADKVKIELLDGKVVLSGMVHSFAAKDAAEQDAWAVQGVHFIENRLAVKYQDQYMRPVDETIRENLQKLISVDPDLYQENIGIFVENGKVSLEGSVGYLFMKMRAEHLARQVGGIEDVSNKLAVVPTRKIADETLGSAIEDHLHKTLPRDANRIVVEVQNGRVVLAGIVSDRRAFDTAEDIARYIDGITDLENRMSIRAQ